MGSAQQRAQASLPLSLRGAHEQRRQRPRPHDARLRDDAARQRSEFGRNTVAQLCAAVDIALRFDAKQPQDLRVTRGAVHRPPQFLDNSPLHVST